MAGKRRKARRVRKPVKSAIEPPRGGLEPVTVSRTDYKHVEGFCIMCGAKVFGDGACPAIHKLASLGFLGSIL